MNRKPFCTTHRALHSLNSHKGNHHGVLELRSRPTQQLLVWHPEAIDKIFRADRRLRRVPSRTLTPLVGRRSLLWAEGHRHIAYRRVLGPALRGTSLQAYHHIISHTVHAALDQLAPDTVISLVEWSRQVTLNIISQILLGHTDGQLLGTFSARVDNVLTARTRALTSHFTRTPEFTCLSSFKRRRELDAMLLRSAKSATNSQPPALAALLLAGAEPIGRIEDRELIEQIKSLLFAGHETTASATAWTLYWISHHEKIHRDIIAELKATSNDGSDPAQVPLLHAASREALRLSPPAFIAGKRVLTADTELLGKPLPAGTIVAPCMYLAHHQPNYFPNPHRFDPSRFMGKRILPQHYFPFGGGTRRCLGSELAMLEIRMISAAVLRRYTLRSVNPETVTPVLRGPTMTLPPGLRMSATPRRRHQGNQSL